MIWICWWAIQENSTILNGPQRVINRGVLVCTKSWYSQFRKHGRLTRHILELMGCWTKCQITVYYCLLQHAPRKKQNTLRNIGRTGSQIPSRKTTEKLKSWILSLMHSRPLGCIPHFNPLAIKRSNVTTFEFSRWVGFSSLAPILLDAHFRFPFGCVGHSHVA